MDIASYLLEHNRYCALIGIVVIFSCAWLLSYHRLRINLRPVVVGFLLQVLSGWFVLNTTMGSAIIGHIAHGVVSLYRCAEAGTLFMFGNLADATGPWGFVFACKVLPIIVFFGAFTALLFYLSVIQCVVNGIGYLLRPLLGTTGPETVCAIANSFLGQTESPLVIRHYLTHMTRSEIFAVMVSGMATISGAILVVFVAMGVPAVHLLASSVMSVPGSLILAKIIYPETEGVRSERCMQGDRDQSAGAAEGAYHSLFDAIAVGTSEGLQLALNVGAMLIVFLTFLHGINGILAWLASHVGYASVLSVEKILGFVCAPFGYLLGFTGDEAIQAGGLIGAKVAINELVAYTQLVSLNVSERMMVLMTYALCGFSNIACIGIQVGGIGVLVPEKRRWLAQFGVRAVLAGALTNLLSAMIVALLL